MTRTSIIALFLVAGCAAAPPPPPTAGAVRTIRYETGPCFGSCPVYVLTVGSDGQGTFESRSNTGVTGSRSFSIAPAQFADFEARLAPYRPAGERRLAMGDECNDRVATDMPSVDIRWSGKGPSSHLYVYYGCNMEANAAMFKALQDAPEAIPEVRDLIATR